MFGELLAIRNLLHTLVAFFLHSPLLMADKEEMVDPLKRGQNLLGVLETVKGGKTSWMSHIKNDTWLCRLTVPGTHDAAAYNYKGPGHEYWNCQSLPLFQQLDAGIRALDLRYGVRDGKLRFFHSTALLDEDAEVEDIIRGLKEWLKLHPTETIFVSLKVDTGDPYADDVKELMGKVLTKTQEFWVDNLSTTTTLREARGKLVLVRRFPFNDKVGFDVSHDWKENLPYFEIILDEQQRTKACIEDFFLLQNMPGQEGPQIDRKLGETVAHLEKAKESKSSDLWITFSSAVGDKRQQGENVTPRVMALGRGNVAGMNSRLRDWCKQQTNETPIKPVGIVLMDFVTLLKEPSTDQTNGVTLDDDDLIQLLIDRNITE